MSAPSQEGGCCLEAQIGRGRMEIANWGIANWFGRRPAPKRLLPEDLPDTPIDWERGDVAVLRSDSMGPWVCAQTHHTIPGPSSGQRLAVELVYFVEGIQFLVFAAYEGGFHAFAFDRLRGDQAEACEEEFIKLVRRDFATAPMETVE
jgi:hypothetical protein